jgi:hypothetical protein
MPWAWSTPSRPIGRLSVGRPKGVSLWPLNDLVSIHSASAWLWHPPYSSLIFAILPAIKLFPSYQESWPRLKPWPIWLETKIVAYPTSASFVSPGWHVSVSSSSVGRSWLLAPNHNTSRGSRESWSERLNLKDKSSKKFAGNNLKLIVVSKGLL